MRHVPKSLGAAVLAVLLATWPGRAAAQGNDSPALRRAISDFSRLRADLDRINAEVAQLKQADRTVRNDYRLRDRMADAEAMAQKVTQAEARLRAFGWKEVLSPTLVRSWCHRRRCHRTAALSSKPRRGCSRIRRENSMAKQTF